MAKVNSFLSERLKSASKTLSKLGDFEETPNAGQISSFSGVFRVTPLTEKEKEELKAILTSHSERSCDIDNDLTALSDITSEVKAINNQASILHGERIKKAQNILKDYTDGAFSSWLVSIYGNRQTPYNLLQYYEFYTSLPQELQPKVDEMPRQAVYTLASRSGSNESKREIVENYHGEPKQELLSKIREKFPLVRGDKRYKDLSNHAINALQRLLNTLKPTSFKPNGRQKQQLRTLISSLQQLIED